MQYQCHSTILPSCRAALLYFRTPSFFRAFVLVAVLVPNPCFATDESLVRPEHSSRTYSKWFVKLGASWVKLDSSADAFASTGNGHFSPIAGGNGHLTNNVTPTLEGGYYITSYFSVSGIIGVPPKTTFTGRGSLRPYGVLGKAMYGPAMLSGQYHFDLSFHLHPYVGGGVSYAIILQQESAAIQRLRIADHFGQFVEGGLDYDVARHLGVFFDYKKMWLHTYAKGNILSTAGTPVKAKVYLDPMLFTIGLRYSF